MVGKEIALRTGQLSETKKNGIDSSRAAAIRANLGRIEAAATVAEKTEIIREIQKNHPTVPVNPPSHTIVTFNSSPYK